MTHPADGPLPPWLTGVPFAHRGLHGEGVPENSLAAVEAAVSARLGVEVDVRLTADEVPVVVHDDDLERLTGRPGRVSASTVAALRTRRLGDTDLGIPTLAAVTDAVGGRVPVMLELKHRGVAVGALEAAVAAHLEGYRGPVCVVSFHPLALAWLRRRAPGLIRGQTAAPDPGPPGPIGASLARLWWNPVSRPHFVSYALGALPTPATTRWRSRGRVLIAWTARSRADLETAGRLADNVIVEGPAAREAVSRRARGSGTT